jgi:hypothetical protein
MQVGKGGQQVGNGHGRLGNVGTPPEGCPLALPTPGEKKFLPQEVFNEAAG